MGDFYAAWDKPARETTSFVSVSPLGHVNGYAGKALADEVEAVRTTQEGQRNHRLYVAARNLGELSHAGLSQDTITVELTRAGRACGLDEMEIDRTITSGLNAGLAEPRVIPPLPDPPPVTVLTPPAALDESRRSWQPVDLADVLDGRYVPPQPTVGARSDGAGVFYPRRQHTVTGESESGKTTLLLGQVMVELSRGNSTVWVDFEDDEGGVVSRLLAGGADRMAVQERFAYLRPEDPIGALANRGDLAQALGDLLPTLAVLDGVTEAMTMHGLDPLSNKDAATFGRLLPRYIAEHGPATVSLDHVTKSNEGRGRYAIGAVHKLNGLNGSALIVENRMPLGVGMTGRSTVLVAKDRPGQVRRFGLSAAGGATWFADLLVVGHDMSFMEVSLEAPGEREDFRATVLMGKVAAALDGAPEPLSVRGVLDRVRAKRDTDVRAALARLVDEQYVVMESGTRGAHLHRLVKPFQADE